MRLSCTFLYSLIFLFSQNMLRIYPVDCIPSLSQSVYFGEYTRRISNVPETFLEYWELKWDIGIWKFIAVLRGPEVRDASPMSLILLLYPSSQYYFKFILFLHYVTKQKFTLTLLILFTCQVIRSPLSSCLASDQRTSLCQIKYVAVLWLLFLGLPGTPFSSISLSPTSVSLWWLVLF